MHHIDSPPNAPQVRSFLAAFYDLPALHVLITSLVCAYYQPLGSRCCSFSQSFRIPDYLGGGECDRLFTSERSAVARAVIVRIKLWSALSPQLKLSLVHRQSLKLKPLTEHSLQLTCSEFLSFSSWVGRQNRALLQGYSMLFTQTNGLSRAPGCHYQDLVMYPHVSPPRLRLI